MMERALLLARRAGAAGEVPVAAIIYRGEEILSEAHNRRELHPDPTGHAEILAIREAGRRLGAWRLLGCTLAVTLEPCAMCAGALVNARIARLIYGASDARAGACESLYRITTDPRLNHRLTVHRGLYARACTRLLTRFFESRREQIRRARSS
jgi:tRNA(adenine34) deaminase